MKNIKITSPKLSEEKKNTIIMNIISLIMESNLNINSKNNIIDNKIKKTKEKIKKKNELMNEAENLIKSYEDKNQSLLLQIEKKRNVLLEKLGIFL